MVKATREQVLTRIEARLHVLSLRAAEQLREHYPPYRSVEVDALLPGIEEDLRRGVTALSERRLPTAPELEEVARVAQVRAHQGVPLEDMLQGFHAVGRLAWEAMREEATEARLEAGEVVALAEDVWQWLDEVTACAARAHREVDVELASRDAGQRVALLRALLSGTYSLAHVRSRLVTWGLPADAEYVTFRARPVADAAAGPWVRRLESRLGRALVALVDEDVVGIAERAPGSDDALVVGVGPRASLAHVAESFASATRALDTAAALGLPGAHTLGSLGIRPALVADTAIGEALVHRYLDGLEGSPRIQRELEESLTAFIDSRLSVNAAAEQLVVHPNTLRYRLKRFEELTGAELRDPVQVAEVWWALQRRRIGAVRPGRWID